ncbi:hypothetical protein QBC46DRAFT_89716 [Diplogelasinospora grovesii]|uniref:Zinc finger PHD-type domain-containing protein n=1 Tax=Diplogelasinospora grovesii TaxID=303347 RepID=A0AAN6S637_9PEZI|nr:hypothetical protein QBC46DRAFT_89716 [Diplogelasinospora grovesii]
MPSVRKRLFQEAAADHVEPPKEPSVLHRIRNMWQFANLYQFICLFGKALKLDDNLDIEDLEAECLKPGSMALQDIGLGLLKFISSHRGLTHDLFDEYTRRQYLSKAPEKNPFGTDETPAKFVDFDVFTKIRVLQQMTQFVMMNPERLREKAEEPRDIDQTGWRIEPYGWDREDRTYFVLDDNRIYRQTEAPPPAPKPKKNSKKARAAQRASKRRRISGAAASDADDAGDEGSEGGGAAEPEDDGLGGMKWECVAVTLDEVREFLSTIQSTKDSNEKILRDQIKDHLVPILERQEESRKRKQLQREKELLNLEKLARAKRSSRLASKAEQQKMEEQAREEERKRREEEAARRKEEQKQLKMERERDNRQMSREQRLKEREVRRLQHEEELAQLSEDSKSTGTGLGRMSERRRQAEIEKRQQALKELEEEEADWIFDCICGVYGQIDDGSHSVACERCNVWQHSKCLGIAEEDAEQDDFHFICNPCRRAEQADKDGRPRIIKLKVNRPGSPSSPSTSKAAEEGSPPQPTANSQLVVELESGPVRINGGDNHTAALDGDSREELPTQPAEQTMDWKPNGNTIGQATTVSSKNLLNGHGGNPFSSPHPTLSPPGQSPNKSRAYNSIFEGSSPVPSNSHGSQVLPIKSSHTKSGSLLGLSPPAGNGVLPSPVKEARRASSPSATKTSPSVPSASAGSDAISPSRKLTSTPSAPTSLLLFTPVQSFSHSEDGGDERPSPLPPSRGGLSPTKHSPPSHKRQLSQTNGSFGSFTTPRVAPHPPAAVYPPVTALSPSPQPQVLTPPVKHTEPVRSASPKQTRKPQAETNVQSTS